MCIEKKHWKGIVISAIFFAIVAQVIHTFGAYASMSYYTNPAYFPLWSKLMMPAAGAPPAEFFVLTLALALLTAVFYAAAYAMLMDSIPGKTFVKKGLVYGLLLFLVAIVPGYLSMALLINIPLTLVAGWILESLAALLVGGVIIAKFVQ